ncbi:MAG: undecaprenyldiphospho-muramoylpentapeptide beta-N-acetylglucosaminyltransferase [Bacteroidetes bacterium]|nr:MAG: undecaprenyldiphospho-muramoylpentapeptide beta-N-acetylglucosaminyltransferase [Bacteroidota bacterium]
MQTRIQKTSNQQPVTSNRIMKILISGGGTGGHIFPAIAIADAIKKKNPDVDILFVGAKGKIEMEKVPNAGYPIKGLWISGFHRKLTLRNLMFPVKLLSSMVRSWSIVSRFKPDAVVGVGGFASGPVLEVATRKGIPALIQEQNSYAGVTNKLVSRKADVICVAYENMDRYFPGQKLKLTGNPVRQDLRDIKATKEEALEYFGLKPGKKTLLVFGGSLGARTINEAMAASADMLKQHPDIQVLWQAGKLYIDEFTQSETAQLPNVQIRPFIDRMDLAYKMADLVACRAGALTISELCLVGKPAILIPFPHAAADHQTKNAMALVEKGAAFLVKDSEAREVFNKLVLNTIEDGPKLKQLGENIKTLAKPDAADTIAEEVIRLAQKQ